MRESSNLQNPELWKHVVQFACKILVISSLNSLDKLNICLIQYFEADFLLKVSLKFWIQE